MSIVPPNGQAGQQPQFDITQTSPVRCSVCGNQTFHQVYFLRRLSGLIAPGGKDAHIPVMSFACGNCGAVPTSLVPPFIREEYNESTEEGIPSQAESNPLV